MDGNSAFLTDFVGAMSTSTVADIVNGNQAWVTDLVTKLDTNVIAGVANAPGTLALSIPFCRSSTRLPWPLSSTATRDG